MPHTQDWNIRIHLFEDDDGTTRARAVLEVGGGGGTALTGQGMARRNPRDRDVPEIGDELAAGRAMSDLAQKLLSVARSDIEGVAHPGP
ncbi:MAG TPA: dsRBD fold-containing protein [Streptomyces sp.]|nr:dsRBD fold-containing protein [Streptomyces sp.]